MKKTLTKFALVLAMVFAAWHFGHAQAQLADFRITMEPSARGGKLECLKGCSWKTLTFTCSAKEQPCKRQVDQAGVGPVGAK